MRLLTAAKLGLLVGLTMISIPGFSQDNATTNGAIPSSTMSATTTPQEDKIINDKIKSLVAQSKALSTVNVDVRTDQGVVTLNGTVNSDSEASEFIELAQSVVGVKDVDTANLNIKGSQHPLADSIITAKVKGLFIREKIFGDKDIAAVNLSVETTDGVVYLTGYVDNDVQMQNAIKIAQSVNGVKKVIYRVKKMVPANNGASTTNTPVTTNTTPSNQ